jgi:hypothetical protein
MPSVSGARNTPSHCRTSSAISGTRSPVRPSTPPTWPTLPRRLRPSGASAHRGPVSPDRVNPDPVSPDRVRPDRVRPDRVSPAAVAAPAAPGVRADRSVAAARRGRATSAAVVVVAVARPPRMPPPRRAPAPPWVPRPARPLPALRRLRRAAMTLPVMATARDRANPVKDRLPHADAAGVIAAAVAAVVAAPARVAVEPPRRQPSPRFASGGLLNHWPLSQRGRRSGRPPGKAR